jgi:hypothetical protein
MTVVLGIEFAALAVVLLMIRRERIATIARILACMKEYLPTGLVTNADLTMLSSLKQRKQTRDWARANRGKQGFIAMRDYQLACTELSELHDRASRGQVTPQEFQTQQQNLLALMKFARDAFLGPAPAPQPSSQPFIHTPEPQSMTPPSLIPPSGSA